MKIKQEWVGARESEEDYKWNWKEDTRGGANLSRTYVLDQLTTLKERKQQLGGGKMKAFSNRRRNPEPNSDSEEWGGKGKRGMSALRAADLMQSDISGKRLLKTGFRDRNE